MSDDTEAIIDFRTRPVEYRHWRLTVESPIARLVLDVDENAPLRGEYKLILQQALTGVPYVQTLESLIDACSRCEPATVRRVVPDDPDDDKLVALAVAAEVDVLITSDSHLLCLHPCEGIPILTPGEALQCLPDAVD